MAATAVVDIYHGNDVEDFAKAKAAGVCGIIHKASQGAMMKDHRYGERRALALEAGLLFGAYHFLTNVSVSMQAANFFDVVEPDETTLLCVDYEHSKSTPNLVQLKAFCTAVLAVYGRRPVIYSGDLLKESMKNIADTPERFWGRHRLWLAQYGNSCTLGPLRCWDSPWLWQFTDKGEIPGFPNKCDVSTYDGTAEKLASEWAS